MKRLLLSIVLALTALPAVSACPMCKETIPQGATGVDDFDPTRESSGYNYSIYFMLVTPFVLATSAGLFIYRQCRRIDRHQS